MTMASPDDPDALEGQDGLLDVRGEPEPDWVEGIRRSREERAHRLRSLLGSPEHPEAPGSAPSPGAADPAQEHRERPS